MTMLTSRTVPRLRPLQVASSLRLRHPIQIRAFRFGIWSSCFDPASQRELRRRHRNIKQKYADNISQRLPWRDYEDLFTEPPRVTLKRTLTQFWTPPAAHNSLRWVDQDMLDGWKKASSSLSYTTWKLQLNQVIDALQSRLPPDMKSQYHMETGPGNRCAGGSNRSSNSSSQMPKWQKTIQKEETGSIGAQNYRIDPITNRKVPRGGNRSEETDFGTQRPTVQNYDSQSMPFDLSIMERDRPPVYSNGKPPATELKKYAESEFDSWPTTEMRSSIYPNDRPSAAELSKYAENEFDDWSAAGTRSSADSFDFTESSARHNTASRTFKPALKNEEYSLNHLPLEDPIEDCGDLSKNRTSTTDEPSKGPSDVPKRHDTVGRVSFDRDSDVGSTQQPVSNPDRLQTELRNYGPYMYEENPLPQNVQDSEDLDKYRYSASEEPELLPESTTTYDDLHRYKYTGLEEAEAKDQPFEQYGDLERYKDFRLQHLDTTVPPEQDVITESLKEYEAKEQFRTVLGGGEAYGYETPKTIPRMEFPEGHVFSEHYSRQMNAEAGHTSSERNPGESHQNTTNFGAKSSTVDRGNSDLQRACQELIKEKVIVENGRLCSGKSPGATEKEVSQPALDRSRNGFNLESALNRHISSTKSTRHLSPVFGADFYSKTPQGLETSFCEEHEGKHTMPLYRRDYTSEPGQVAPGLKRAAETNIREYPDRLSGLYYHRDPEIDGVLPLDPTNQTRNEKPAHPDEPTLYKILAYDSATRTINVAETNSVTPDLAAPLSPTEVLPRLSNPAKFIPHFAHLQAEGFEIVSGSGDILVFRQVRPARAGGQSGTVPVNPIDLMGSSTAVPNAAAFVSPTGFVNYDMPQVEEVPTEPPRQPNAPVCREEPVFSGQQSSSRDQNGKKPRMNVGKRVIIGGVSVAGMSYALGVVSEFFTTGGADGTGPTGI